MKKILHWNEGLFLQPQHLQVLQRQSMEMTGIERGIKLLFPYGVIRIKLFEDDLANKRIRLEELEVVMPSGIYLNLGDNLTLPALDVREKFSVRNESFDVFLGIPLFDPSRANTASIRMSHRSQNKYLYHVNESDVVDENTGESTRSIEFLSVNGKILLQGDNFEGFEVIPLFRVVQGTGENLGQPQVSPDFCGPSLTIGAYSSLMRTVSQLNEQITASRKDIFRKFRAQGFNRDQVQSNHLDLMLRSRSMISGSVALNEFVQAEKGHPLDVYVELKKLYGELVCLNPDVSKNGQNDVDPLELIPDYEHENPIFPIGVLSKKIREILGDVVVPEYLEVIFKRKADHYYAEFESRHFTQPDNYYLGIESKGMQPHEIYPLIEDIDVFKFMPISMMGKVLRGVRLKQETHVPHQLPRKSYMYYFQIITGGRGSAWEKISKEKEAIIEWNGFETSDFKIRIFMTESN